MRRKTITACANEALFWGPGLSAQDVLTGFLGSMIAHTGYGLILASADGRIIYANDAAKALMREDFGLRRTNRCLSATDFRSSQELQKLILAAARQPNKLPQGGSLVLRNEDGTAALAIHAMPLSGDPGGFRFPPLDGGSIAGLHIFPCRRGISGRVKIFSQLFALTPAETRVLRQLLLGGGTTYAASQLNIAQSTAQTHIKRILEKTGAHRQAELIQTFYEITIPSCGRDAAKRTEAAPWQAARAPASENEGSRGRLCEEANPKKGAGAHELLAGRVSPFAQLPHEPGAAPFQPEAGPGRARGAQS